jgi:hypothetical protein
MVQHGILADSAEVGLVVIERAKTGFGTPVRTWLQPGRLATSMDARAALHRFGLPLGKAMGLSGCSGLAVPR